MNPKFILGQVEITPGALEAFVRAGLSPAHYLRRHVIGDWGDVPPEDARENEYSLRHGFRVISSYRLPTGIIVWAISEADRSLTTLLTPSEY